MLELESHIVCKLDGATVRQNRKLFRQRLTINPFLFVGETSTLQAAANGCIVRFTQRYKQKMYF